jgi:hypothetical protein
MLEYPFTLYQTLSLFLNGITSLLLVYFGLHQHASTLRKTRSAKPFLNNLKLEEHPDSSIDKILPTVAINNYGPGDLDHIQLNKLILTDSKQNKLLESENFINTSGTEEICRPGENRNFQTNTLQIEDSNLDLDAIGKENYFVELRYDTESGKDFSVCKVKQPADTQLEIIELLPTRGPYWRNWRHRIEAWIARNL